MHIELDQAISIKRQNLNHLFSRRNVVGVGVGYKESEGVLTDELAVVVNVAQKVPKAQLAESDTVPRDLDGVRTDVVETGRFLAGQGYAQGTKDRWRPTIPAGVSIGHVEVTAGTLGCLVRRGSEIFILSNNHVLANVNQARPGDAIIQPARYDGGTLADQVATLAEYIPIDFGGTSSDCNVATGLEKALNAIAQALGSQHRMTAYRASPGQNLIDVALARPLNPNQFNPEILKIGRPKGVHQATLGTNVQKTGRTTDHTRGQIVQIEVTTSVEYNGRIATFTDQLMANGMSAGGDSGSAVLDEQGYMVGLLFAGSNVATLINPIQTVLSLLNVEIVL
ncbi:MAG: trypsin-like serine protease [Anaerolineae bacterium]|nr:trypsin-like serine protease [Anaerolineae bacterium]